MSAQTFLRLRGNGFFVPVQLSLPPTLRGRWAFCASHSVLWGCSAYTFVPTSNDHEPSIGSDVRTTRIAERRLLASNISRRLLDVASEFRSVSRVASIDDDVRGGGTRRRRLATAVRVGHSRTTMGLRYSGGSGGDRVGPGTGASSTVLWHCRSGGHSESRRTVRTSHSVAIR